MESFYKNHRSIEKFNPLSLKYVILVSQAPIVQTQTKLIMTGFLQAIGNMHVGLYTYKQIRNNLKIKPKSFLTELVPLAYWLIMELNEKSQLKVSLLPL